MDTITDFFENDHRRLDTIFTNFTNIKKDDFERAKDLFEQFKNGLKQHIMWEEDILFPIFEQRTGNIDSGPTFVMRHEHRQIEDILQTISSELDRSNIETGELERDLARVLLLHNQKEEIILYPWIDRTLTQDETSEILKKISSQG